MVREFDERNLAKSRAVCAAMAERAGMGRRALSERERRILDMWPRFEDGEPVIPGDKVHYASTHNDETAIEVESITVMDGFFVLCDDECRSNQYEQGQRVKRPVQSVLDADGVEIEAGDTVYEPNGQSGIVTAVHPSSRCVNLRQDGCDAYAMDAKRLTHTRPDSWERLEEDAVKVVCEYADAVPDEFGDYDCDTCHLFDARGKLICEQQMALDIVRRAKALAGVEVGE